MNFVLAVMVAVVVVVVVVMAHRGNFARAWKTLDLSQNEKIGCSIMAFVFLSTMISSYVLGPSPAQIRESKRVGDSVALLSGYQAGMSREGARAYSLYVRENAEHQLNSHILTPEGHTEGEQIFWLTADEYLQQHPEYTISKEEEESMHPIKAASINNTPQITILAEEPE